MKLGQLYLGGETHPAIKNLESVFGEYDVIAYDDGDVGILGQSVDVYFSPKQTDKLIKALKLARKTHNKQAKEVKPATVPTPKRVMIEGLEYTVRYSNFATDYGAGSVRDVVLEDAVRSLYITPKEARKLAKTLKRFAASAKEAACE